MRSLKAVSSDFRPRLESSVLEKTVLGSFGGGAAPISAASESGFEQKLKWPANLRKNTNKNI
ncbi:MAG: hypothetical protein DHS20C16_14880 [Phycisphaerae bacterium]|nr:MAG: hypothetical protein DHS20C16_14880 [Phycisphaerae bacterium]